MLSKKSVLLASDGIDHAPRGDRLIVVAFGPSGRHDRLNCWLKNLLIKVFSHFLITLSAYSPLKALQARKNIFSGVKPLQMKL